MLPAAAVRPSVAAAAAAARSWRQVRAVSCRRASARSITAVVPYFGYARADRKVHGRESIAAKLTANLLTEAGVSRLLAIDLHSGQCVGYFDIPVDHVYGEGVLLDYLASKHIPAGAPPRARVAGARARGKRGSAVRVGQGMAMRDRCFGAPMPRLFSTAKQRTWLASLHPTA